MRAPEIMIYKGVKEEKYQLYIEDYVISYLKNYGNRKNQDQFFFYGLREPEKHTYYIYGAASERQLVFFRKYALLEEIHYHYQENMPMLAVQEGNGEYELSGYHIFYQSNEEMQNYMIEQRKILEQKEKVHAEQQNKLDLAVARKKQAKKIKENEPNHNDKRAPLPIHTDMERTAARQRSGLMAIQLSAVFILLVAIVINSTNSYDKLHELGLAATEVFFAMENQDAARENTNRMQESLPGQMNEEEMPGTSKQEAVQRDGTTLYLTEFGEELALENSQDTEPEEANSVSSNDAGKIQDVTEADETNSTAEDAQPVTIIEEASAQAYGRTFAEYYQIEKGDTLYKISQKLYGDTSKVNEICELNQISDPDNIKYGQKILLP